MDRADRRTEIHTERRRATRKEVVSESNTNLETDIPIGEGFGYSPQVFIDPVLATNIPHTEEEEDRVNFIGEYCEKCIGKHDICWCNSSNWQEGLIDIEKPTYNTDPNLESKTPSQTSFRQPPLGWSESRRKAISKNKHH